MNTSPTRLTTRVESERSALITHNSRVPGAGDLMNAIRLPSGDHAGSCITHSEVVGGGELRFVMGDRPNRERGTSKEAKPYSMAR